MALQRMASSAARFMSAVRPSAVAAMSAVDRALATSTPFGACAGVCERVGVSAGAAVTAFIDPSRADMIALLGEVTGEPALRSLRHRMLGDPDGAALLRDRPRIRHTHVDVGALGTLPPGSFGRAYADYLHAYGFNPDERHEVKQIRDPELAYVLTRYREVHDFWHVLSGLPPSVLGETAVKWLEMVQTGLPMCSLSALVAPLRMQPAERRLLRTVYAPWAVRCGNKARFLLAVPYEKHWSTPLDEFRHALRFEPAPPLPLSSPSAAPIA